MSLRRLTVLCLAVASLMAGCEVDQNREVAQYRAVLDIGPTSRPATPATTQPATRPADQPLGLVEAMLMTNAVNEKLAGQGETYLQAIINRSRAVSAFLPTVTGQAAYGMAGEHFPNQNLATFDMDALGTINLFNGFRDVATLKIADLTIEQQKYLLLDVQASLLLNVVQSYFQVMQLEAQTTVLEKALAVQEEGVREVQGRLKAGLARTLDVAQSQAQTAATQVQLLNTRASARNARAGLAFLIGLPSADMPLKEESLREVPYKSREEAVQLGLSTRNDLIAAGKARQAARQGVEVAFGQYYPSVSVNLRYFLEKQSTPANENWDSLISLNVPLFSAGLIHADVRQAWSQYRQATLFESLLYRQITQDVNVAFWNYYTSVERIVELQKQVDAAKLGFTQSEQSYKAGLATNLERLTSQQQYLNSELELTSELYKRRVYAAELARAVGQLRPLLEEAVTGRRATTAPAANPATMPAQ